MRCFVGLGDCLSGCGLMVVVGSFGEFGAVESGS